MYSNFNEVDFFLPGYFITYIDVHPSNPQKIAVTLSNFWVYAAGEKIYISDDAGEEVFSASGKNAVTGSFTVPSSLARRIMHNGGKTKQVNIADLPAGTYSMILHDGKSKVERYFVKKVDI